LLLRVDGSDGGIAHAVTPGLQVTSETMLETWIRMDRNPEVIPTIGPLQRPEFTHLSICFQREFALSIGVEIENAYLGNGSGPIVEPKDNTVTMNIVVDAAHDIGAAIRDASLEDAEEPIRTED